MNANFHSHNSHLFYVRNHLPVPVVVDDDYELTVDAGDYANDPNHATKALSLKELQSLPKHSVTATVMCGGNRRSEMHAVKPVRGLHWGQAAVGTAVWSGARLCDVLTAMGVESDDTSHVHVSVFQLMTIFLKISKRSPEENLERGFR